MARGAKWVLALLTTILGTHRRMDDPRDAEGVVEQVEAPRTLVGLGRRGKVSGLATVWSWEQATGTWVDLREDVPVVATVCDGGTLTKKGTVIDKPDALGMNLPTLTAPGEIPPTALPGGSVKVTWRRSPLS